MRSLILSPGSRRFGLNLEWEFLRFDELDVERLYHILAARQEVFVVGQKLNYVDADGKDPKAWHLIGWTPGRKALVAYLRLLPPGLKYPAYTVGRVLTRPSYRGEGYGKRLMEELLNRVGQEFGPCRVSMAAQAYLETFYQSFGFLKEGEMFYEEGLEHVQMSRDVGHR
jgi:ElaA protein